MAKDRAKLSYLDIIASNAPPGVYDDASLRASLLDTLLSNYDAATLDSYGLLDYIPRFTGDWFLDVPKGIIDEARWNAWKLFHDKEIMALYNNGTEGQRRRGLDREGIQVLEGRAKIPTKVRLARYDAAQGFASVCMGDLRYATGSGGQAARARVGKARRTSIRHGRGAYRRVSIALSGFPAVKPH